MLVAAESRSVSLTFLVCVPVTIGERAAAARALLTRSSRTSAARKSSTKKMTMLLERMWLSDFSELLISLIPGFGCRSYRHEDWSLRKEATLRLHQGSACVDPEATGGSL